MNTTRHAVQSFVHTITLMQQPYLFFCERQPEGSFIATCRNSPEILPITLQLLPGKRQWQPLPGLPEAVMPLALGLASFLQEHNY